MRGNRVEQELTWGMVNFAVVWWSGAEGRMENPSAPRWEKVLSIGCVLANREESSSIIVEMKAELMR